VDRHERRTWVRFDGVHFVVFNRENQPAFQDDSFYSLSSPRMAPLGGTEGGGLVRYRTVPSKCLQAEAGYQRIRPVIFEDRSTVSGLDGSRTVSPWSKSRSSASMDREHPGNGCAFHL